MPEFCGLDANGLFSDAVRVVVFAGDVRRCSWTQRPVPQLASLCFRIIRVQSSSSHAASRLGSVERRLQARLLRVPLCRPRLLLACLASSFPICHLGLVLAYRVHLRRVLRQQPLRDL